MKHKQLVKHIMGVSFFDNVMHKVLSSSAKSIAQTWSNPAKSAAKSRSGWRLVSIIVSTRKLSKSSESNWDFPLLLMSGCKNR